MANVWADPSRAAVMQGEKIQGLYEYAFYHTIQNMNKQIQDYNKEHIGPAKPLIRTTEARRLRQRLDAHLAAQTPEGAPQQFNIRNSPTVIFARALNRTLTERGLALFDDEPVFIQNEMQSYLRDYSAILGLNGDNNEHYVPMSPFDPRWSNNAVFLKNGMSMLYARSDSDNPNENLYVADGQTVRMNNVQLMAERREAMVPVGQFVTASDMSGMTRLSQYIPMRDFDKLADWVNAVGRTDPNMYMTPQAVDRAVAILDHLQKNGTKFEIVRDQRPGQLKAKLTGTNVTVRLTAARPDESYVGKVYDDGLAVYYTTDRKVMENGKYTTVKHTPTAEDCIRLIDFAMGKPVTRTDMPGVPVGGVGTYGFGNKKNSTYHSSGNFAAVVGDIPGMDGGKIKLYVQNNRSKHRRSFETSEDADAFVREAVKTARRNFENSLDLDSLIEAKQRWEQDPEVEPIYSGDPGVATVQHTYWQVLTGQLSTLKKPTMDVELSDEDDFEGSIEENVGVVDEYYDAENMTPEEICRQHVQDSVDTYIGVYYPGPDDNPDDPMFKQMDDGKLFNCEFVQTYMSNGNGGFVRNEQDMIAAMRKLGITADDLRDGPFHLNRIGGYLSSFQPTDVNGEKARTLDEIIAAGQGVNAQGEPVINTSVARFAAQIRQTVIEAVNGSGCVLGHVNEQGQFMYTSDDLMIDSRGVIKYNAVMAEGVSSEKGRFVPITGEIGQVFLPEENGMIRTRYGSGKDGESVVDSYIVPGYEAYVVPQEPGESKTLEQRTRLRGYEQVMCDRIRYQIRSDLLAKPEEEDEKGRHYVSTGSLNWVYRHLYGTNHPLDFMERTQLEGMSEDLRNDIIQTERRRVKYDSVYQENSTINAEYLASVAGDNDLNDNFMDWYQYTGGRDMAILTEEGDGYFDKSATGGGVNQGTVRFLTDRARVLPDGRIRPSLVLNPDGSLYKNAKGNAIIDKDDKTPLMKNEVCRYMDHVPFDRRQMTFSNLLSAACVTEPTGTANMTFGGYTFDDGFVVSKEFAERYKLFASHGGEKGELRNLQVGDKISDHYGNKGVISLIVDRNMSDEKARELGIEEPVAWFKANPDMDVVGAPFAAVSRFNAGSVKELSEDVADLTAPDGSVKAGCLGHTRFIVTHMAVDAKTHVYDKEDILRGKGRKASAQLAWALDAHDAQGVLKEFYGNNLSAYQNLREYMMIEGMDMTEYGEPKIGYTRHTDEHRRIFMQQPVASAMKPRTTTKDGKTVTDYRVDHNMVKQDILSLTANAGGFMEIPFELDLAAGNKTPPMTLQEGDKVVGLRTWFERDAKNQAVVDCTDMLKSQNRGTFLLPVMSSHLRSGIGVVGEDFVVHDYTMRYQRIADESINYRVAQAELGKVYKQMQGLDQQSGEYQKLAVEYQKYAGQMNEAKETAQTHYDAIATEVQAKIFSGKHNIFRDSLMANKLDHSATAVWTADPRLDIDQVGMPKSMMDELELKEGDYTMIWRDPVLRGGATRYMRVTQVDGLTGIAINPIADKSFDGDFDGDSAGVSRLTTPEAQKDAMQKLTMEANLLDKSSKRSDGLYPFYVNDGLDLKSAMAANPEFAERWEDLVQAANRADKLSDVNARLGQNRVILKELSKLTHDMFDFEYGNSMVCFKDGPSHIASLEHMVQSGAKGSISKLKDYGKYLGMELQSEKDENGVERIVYDNVPEDISKLTPLTGREEDKGVQRATAVKSFGTGIAGMFSQRGVSCLRNECIGPVLELTYQVTQCVLQSKHDPVQAAQIYEQLQSTCRNLWRGYDMDKDEHGKFKVRYENGQPVQASAEKWAAMFKEIYGSKEYMNVPINEEYVDILAHVLSQPVSHVRSVQGGYTGINVDGDIYGQVGKALGADERMMMNIEQDAKKLYAAPLDRLAYGGTFNDLMDMVKNGDMSHKDDDVKNNLFAGKYNMCFMPRAVQRNLMLWKEGRIDEMKAIMRADTKAVHDIKLASIGVTKDKNFAQGVAAEVEAAAEEAIETEVAQSLADVSKNTTNPNGSHGGMGE